MYNISVWLFKHFQRPGEVDLMASFPYLVSRIFRGGTPKTAAQRLVLYSKLLKS